MEFLKKWLENKKNLFKNHLSFYGFVVFPFYSTTCIIGRIIVCIPY